MIFVNYAKLLCKLNYVNFVSGKQGAAAASALFVQILFENYENIQGFLHFSGDFG